MSKILRNTTASTISYSTPGVSIAAGVSYTIPPLDYSMWSGIDALFTDIGSGAIVVNDGSADLGISDGINSIKGIFVKALESTISIPWSEFKVFVDSMGADFLHLSHIELTGYYIAWVDFRGMHIRCQISKSDAACAVFEASYKPKSNTKEADRVRITTCKVGRRLSDRSLTFTTSMPGSLNNDDWKAVDFGDATYSIRDFDGVETTVPLLARQTWLDFYPTYDFEICGGGINLPAVLAGDQDLWEIHVLGAPDIPAAYGGNVNFVANNRIKWVKGGQITIDASLNPAELTGAVSPFARKIRFIILHPLGAQSEFQINIKVFK